jgi:hypothetical protein
MAKREHPRARPQTSRGRAERFQAYVLAGSLVEGARGCSENAFTINALCQ